ncbi:MAG TPA: hypothetical protein VFW22_11690 [Pseudolabrys sp.]|nr:hypothetical protein [Pseudolabrys sp.]
MLRRAGEPNQELRQAPFIVAACLLVVGSGVWLFWLDPDKAIIPAD